MNILVLSDSYKGTLSSKEVGETIVSSWKKVRREDTISFLPFADGGEGTLVCLKEVFPSAKERRVKVTRHYPEEKGEVSYLIYKDTAIIESALVMGLFDIKVKDPRRTTTYGVGELIRDALNSGIRKFIITLGGSSTNDGGAGMLAALGVRFVDSDGKEFLPTGGNLNRIDGIDISHLDHRIRDCQFTLLSDVTNVLLGKNGATYTFSLQKGADESLLPVLERNMNHLAKMMNKVVPGNRENLPGSGAAGGLGYGFLLLDHVRVTSGAEEIIRLYDLKNRLKNVDLLITGEGKTDASSFNGKAVYVLSKYAKAMNVRVMLISGMVDQSVVPQLKELGIDTVLEVNQDHNRSFAEISLHARDDLSRAVVKYLLS